MSSVSSESTEQSLKEIIPFIIWHRQKCTNCCRVLSVGYVMISSKVEHVCGRCITLIKYRNFEFAKSLYNVVACGFSFSCMNCYFGCDKSFSIFNMLPHESECKRPEEEPSEIRCEFCAYKGFKTFEMVTHTRRFHLGNALFDGAKTQFATTLEQYTKRLFFLEDGIFVMHWDYDISTMILKISIDCVSAVKPRRFTVKIENPGDPTHHIILQVDSIDVLTVEFEQNYNHCIEEFGYTEVLVYELIVENLDYNIQTQAMINKYLEVREKEQVKENIYESFQAEIKKQDAIKNKYNMTLNILKYVAPNILKCSNCNILNPGMKLYFCSEGHICCRACIHPKCEACKGPREFNLLDELKQLLVRCDWPGCNLDIKLHYLMSHKAICSHRTYLCPLKGCYKSFTSIKEFSDHWHACTPSVIVCDSSMVFNKGTHQEFFWIFNHDIYRLFIKFDEEIEVIIEDFDVVFINNRIYCYGIKKNVRKEIPSRIFCGHFQVSISNRQTKYPDQYVYEYIEIEITKMSN